ncbi:restriction endonuclease subunit S [Streptomyces violascens]|uniref:restriction endonuclease subunit S n=1 Tax=Streptomyces violascens TaxID=67381 RepID=UPI0036BB6EA0
MKDIATITSGSTPARARDEFWGGEFPWVRTGEINFDEITHTSENVTESALRNANLKVFPRGTVLVAMYGDGATRGRSAILGIEATVNQATAAIICNPRFIDSRFLFYFLEHKYEEIRKISQGSNRSNLNASLIGQIMVATPPVEEQRRIVDFLTAESDMERSIEESIEKNRRVRLGILLEALKPINQTSSPVGWARLPLKEVVPVAEYGISEALTNDPRGVPVLRMNNIHNGQPNVLDIRYSPTPVPERLRLRRGDVLFNRTNSIEHIGKSATWKDELAEATFASYLVRLNPDKNRLLPEYLVEWLHHPLIRQRVKAISTVAVQQVNVNPTRLRELEIDLPVALEEQDRIVKALAACDERIRHDQSELAKLRKLKLGLTDKLLTRKPQ